MERAAADFFILFAAAEAASTIACGLVRQSIPAQVRSPAFSVGGSFMGCTGRASA